MSVKWSGSQSESGILRKNEYKEKKEELFVFGYSCKLFREDDRALLIDQGKHLIPWMGDETLKIDRYDARGALHELSRLEAPPGGYDWRVELTRAELDVEQLCDEERYRALHTNEDEEEMYKEEELKRLHAAGYGQVGFNYDAPAETTQATQPVEVDEPFIPTPEFKALLPTNIVLPETLKQNAIIEKTAKFIASQGAQMEILIKAKQGDNAQFQFLNKDSTLHPYYSALISLIKSAKWPEKKPELVEDKLHEAVDEYLHPSLATPIIESAPSIPSIHYKPSADCDYTMLISKMKGEAILDEVFPPELAPGEVAPPGTEPLPPRAKEIYHPPVLYGHGQAETTPQPAQVTHYQQYAAYYQHCPDPATVQPALIKPQPEPVANHQHPTSLKSTGLSLMKNYNTDSDSDVSDFDDASSTDSKDKPAIITPPEDVQVVVEKMASYVARNGDEFADIVRAKNDPRFTFLEPDNMYHAYYRRLIQEKRGIANGQKKEKEDGEKWNVPVSFSIKKLKEPDPILPKPALPYETSSDEDLEKQGEKQENNQEMDQTQIFKSELEKTEKDIQKVEEVKPQLLIQQTFDMNNIPPVIVYKMEGQLTKDLPLIRAIEPLKKAKVVLPPNVVEVKEVPKQALAPIQQEKPVPKPAEVKEKTPVQEPKDEERTKDPSPTYRREKRKHRDRKKEYVFKSECRERRADRSPDREKRRAKESDRDRKRAKYNKDEFETEIISLEDNSDELIDLTGEQSDSRGEGDVETDRVKQQSRRRRAAEFLKKVGVDPAAATLPTTSLASAMVDTLESIRRKKAEEEEKRRRREKRRHRDRREDDSYRKSHRRKYRSSENEESDYDSSKKKKRKKDKKNTTKSKKKRRREEEFEEGNEAIPLNIDLTSTLKELRTYSPTKDLFLQNVDQNSQPSYREDSSDEDDSGEVVRDRMPMEKKLNRQYSEGEWSSNSEDDSRSSTDLI